jgi:hypothetical protein
MRWDDKKRGIGGGGIEKETKRRNNRREERIENRIMKEKDTRLRVGAMRPLDPVRCNETVGSR